MLEELSEQQILAARTVLEYADIEPNDDNLRRYISWEIVTFTEDAKGHYCWYMDDEGNEICIQHVNLPRHIAASLELHD